MAEPLSSLNSTLRGDATQIAPARPDESLYAGRYRLEGLVGRGGMGAVYRAVDVLVGDVVALKILDGVTPQQLEWFRREVRLARKISHPNVARTHDMGEHGGAAYLSMEFVEGGTLQELLRQHPRGLDAARAARIALAVCEALAAAHAAGVVHRDLKPANVLLEAEGRVVLTDFGIARSLDDDGRRTLGLLGTPLYMAPEQVAGRSIDARADLYAVGIVLFEMLTGALPFTGDNAMSAALARLQDPPRDVLSLRPDAPAPLAQLIHHCLALEPEHRPASAAEVAERLRGWLRAAGETLAALPTAHTLAAPSHGQTTTPTSGALAPTLAVLPLRYQGPPDTAYYGDALSDELIDALSRTRGPRVLGSGATARYRDVRDPRAIGVDLGAALLVDATLQATPKQWRVQVRLVEVPSGLQLWSDRFEAAADDPLAAQDILSKRIAEALRVELMTIAHRGGAPQEAIALYLRARRKIAGAHIIGSDGAVELLEECLRLAPNFRPALAAHAIACARARFFVATGAGEPRDWVATTEAAVARAVEAAPDLPETHLARGMLAVQDGHWREAVRAFVLALEFAPFSAQAHEYLAQLQCEAGNIEEGVARARLTAALDPTMLIALNHVARVHALRGDREAWARTLAPLAAQPHFQFIGLVIEARVSGWFGDTERLRDILRRVDSLALGGRARAVVLIARAFLREYTRDELLAGSELLLANSPSPRLYTTTCQISCEACAANDLLDEALGYLERAAASRLIDLDWLDHCPSLAPLRQHPRFLKVRRDITARCETMWIL